MVFISEEEIETLKERLAKKDDKLKNQASELNHLTNEVIPELKKQNKELKKVKKELTEALETSTKKYFDQLEINADLSESVAKKGAGLQLAKVRLEEIEKLVVELEAKANEKEAEIAATEDLSDEEKSIVDQLNSKVDKLITSLGMFSQANMITKSAIMHTITTSIIPALWPMPSRAIELFHVPFCRAAKVPER